MFSALSGLLSPALIVTAFLTGWPSIIALVISYFCRVDGANTYLYSHFNWLISTFWYAFIMIAIAWLLILTLIGVVIGIPLMLITGIWVVYRLCKGFMALHKQKPIY
ncbi:MAG: putative membrane protein [Oleiphilaceae bacterium]|jgi:uncharacterized membrane protein